MAIVKSGGESIVRYSRWLVFTYYALVAASGMIAALSVMAAFGAAVEPGLWKDKLWSVVSWILGALAFVWTAIQMYTMGRAYGDTYVAIGPAGVRIKLPRLTGDLLAIGSERRFPWEEVRDITYEHNLRKRVCTFTAGEYIYTLTQNNCPSPGMVARLMADGKGVPLTAPRVSA